MTNPNPNPARITNELWPFWLAFKAIEPTVRLGGIYANKKGYHNTRAANVLHWPGNYSYADYPADRIGPDDKAAAIDLTFPDAQAGNYSTIARYSARLLASGRDLHDERGNYLREFYGNADHDRDVEGWDFQRVMPVSSDSSHLWHIHLSFIRAHVKDPKAFRAVMSILKGETVTQWRAVETDPAPQPPLPGTRTLRRGMTGPDVAFLQRWLAVPAGAALGTFGPMTEQYVRSFQATRGLVMDSVVGPATWRPILTGHN